MDNRKKQIAKVVQRYLGDSPQCRAYANSLESAARRAECIKNDDQNSPSKEVQIRRMKQLASLLEKTSRLVDTFTYKDWINLKCDIAPTDRGLTGSWDEFEDHFKSFLHAYESGARTRLEKLSSRYGPKDGVFWVFLYWSISDYQLFFDKLPPHSERSKFVQMLQEVGPHISTNWIDRNYSAAIREIKLGEFQTKRKPT